MIASQTPHQISELIYKACKGVGTKDKVLVECMTTFPHHRLLEIVTRFQARYGMRLHDFIKDDTAGNYSKCLQDLCIPREIYEAILIRKSVAGMGTDETLMFEVIACRTPVELKRIALAYYQLYLADMTVDILRDLSGKLKKVACALLSGGRDTTPDGSIDPQEDAEALIKAAKGLGTNESVFIDVLCSRAPAHIARVTDILKSRGKNLRKLIESEFSGRMEEALVLIHSWCCSPQISTAVSLRRAMAGAGTDEARLIRVLVTRYDVHGANQIAAAYRAVYDRDLVKDIKRETSGNFERVLVALVNFRWD
eukprot:gnl/Dysnectes_brevis/1809_a2072_1786.p1 GENE.gnl/Dysnectes_brevis/1809_a2072_1786~~gnl/Dysnectes_brevis/1809_a2072_1786.p1  ORF type:complete len:310 (-),score=90.43 gnl/Dysnectes_brevis/1809_a2072_1786:60-989(-)